MNVAILSAIYGGYDTPALPAAQDLPGHDVGYLMVSDRDCSPWPTVAEPRLMHPRLAAKYPKARPSDYTGADVTIWIDGNIRVTSTTFAAWCLAGLGEDVLALTPHHCADTMAAEVQLAEQASKYDGLPLRQQAARYLEHGFPDGWGNWWSGLIVRRNSCPEFGDAWLREMWHWGCEDQVSLPYVLWQAGLKPLNLPRGGRAHFEFAQHGAEPRWGQL